MCARFTPKIEMEQKKEIHNFKKVKKNKKGSRCSKCTGIFKLGI